MNHLRPYETSSPLFPLNEQPHLPDPRAVRSLILMMDFAAISGGAAAHWGGPSAFTEIFIALHQLIYQKSSSPNWFEDFNFVNDAGHCENALYSLRYILGQYSPMEFEDLLKFRSLQSNLTGHGESHLNPEHVLISNGPLGSAPGVLQGLAMADKLCGKKRISLCTISDGAMMEGETKEALAAIGGLAQKNKIAKCIFLLSNNKTKLSGRIEEDSFAMNFSTLQESGFHYQKIEDGHQIQGIYQALLDAIASPHQAIFLDIHTVKGYGLKSTAESKNGGHGFPLKGGEKEKLSASIHELYDNRPPADILNYLERTFAFCQQFDKKESSPSSVKTEKVQAGIGRALVEMGHKHPVVLLSSDLQGSTGVDPFIKTFPERSFDVGIAEANMVSAAAGFSKNNYISVVNTFAQFGVSKGMLPFFMANLSSAPIIAVFSHAGMQDAADGASHQCTNYLAATYALPRTTVIYPSTSSDAEELMKMSIEKRDKEKEKSDHFIFFLGRENFPLSISEKKIEFGKARLIAEDENPQFALVGYGPMLFELMKAREILKKEANIGTILIDYPFVNKFDDKTIIDALKKTKGNLVVAEDHQEQGSLASFLSLELAKQKISFNISQFALKGTYGRSAYSASELYRYFGIDGFNIAKGLLKK